MFAIQIPAVAIMQKEIYIVWYMQKGVISRQEVECITTFIRFKDRYAKQEWIPVKLILQKSLYFILLIDVYIIQILLSWLQNNTFCVVFKR